MSLGRIQEWNFVKSYPYWLVSYSAVLNKKTCHFAFFSITFKVWRVFFLQPCTPSRDILPLSATWFGSASHRRCMTLLTLLQISQRTRVYPLHNLKERTCWTLIQESLVWVRGVRMGLWGKGRVENHGRRGDSSFSRPPSASQHRRKSLRTLRCTTTLLHAPAQTHRQTNSEEQCFLHPLRNEQVCNLPLYKLVSDTHSHCSDRYYERE